MIAKSKRTLLTAGLAVLLVLVPFPAVAQDQPSDNMQIVLEKLRADKKLFVAQNMGLMESEARAFWPVYRTYQKSLNHLAERQLKLIENYARHYQTMSNGVAKKLVDDYLAVQGDRQKLRQVYLPQFRKVLPEIKVARFYQLENKIHAAVSYDLAAQIPLFK